MESSEFKKPPFDFIYSEDVRPARSFEFSSPPDFATPALPVPLYPIAPFYPPGADPIRRGLNARRAARFRNYDFENSFMSQYLKTFYPVITTKLLLDLVNTTFEHIPPSVRPEKPSRTQKRTKGGLMKWIDENNGEVLNYLAVHPLLPKH
jgi:hypothetical protein